VSRVVFESVSTRRTRKGLCAQCGNKCQVTRDFSQTINPFNRDERGNPKTRAAIMQENARDAAAWNEAPLVCKGCQ
jgi:hypothetical protein